MKPLPGQGLLPFARPVERAGVLSEFLCLECGAATRLVVIPLLPTKLVCERCGRARFMPRKPAEKSVGVDSKQSTGSNLTTGSMKLESPSPETRAFEFVSDCGGQHESQPALSQKDRSHGLL